METHCFFDKFYKKKFSTFRISDIYHQYKSNNPQAIGNLQFAFCINGALNAHNHMDSWLRCVCHHLEKC